MKEKVIDVLYWFCEGEKTLETKFYLSMGMLFVLSFVALPFSFGFSWFLVLVWGVYTGYIFVMHNAFTKSLALSGLLSVPAYFLGGPALALLIFLGAMIFFSR